MNQRQAKIEAIMLAAGILQSAADNMDLCEYPEKDARKIEKEFGKLIEQMDLRWQKMEMRTFHP